MKVWKKSIISREKNIMEKENNKSETFYIYILNILSCFAVICLHHNGAVHSFSNTLGWKQALSVEVLAYWAVPVFYMISGATLMNYRERYSTKIFLKKRFLKVGIPFFAWSGMLLIKDILNGGVVLKQPVGVSFVETIMNIQVLNVYWFFPVIFSIYMIIPVLSLIKDNRRVLWYCVACMFMLYSVLPILCKWLQIQWYSGWKFPVDSAVLYVILGYLLSTEKLNKKRRIVIYTLGICGALIRYLYTYFASIALDDVNRDLFGYEYFPAVLLSVAVFVFVKTHSWKKIKNSIWNKYIVKIASCSFGIYLIHIPIMNFESNILHFPQNILWRSVGVCMTYIVALISVSVMKKIPVVKYIVP